MQNCPPWDLNPECSIYRNVIMHVIQLLHLSYDSSAFVIIVLLITIATSIEIHIQGYANVRKFTLIE